MARASGTDRASRPSSGTASVSAGADGSEGLAESGAPAAGAGQPVVEVDLVPLRGLVARLVPSARRRLVIQRQPRDCRSGDVVRGRLNARVPAA